MLQDLGVMLPLLEANSISAVIFSLFAVWAVSQRLGNKKYSNLFIAMLITSSVTFSAIAFNNDTINDLVLLFQQTKQNNALHDNIAASFSPKQGAEKLIIDSIQKAEKSIFVAAYSFTSKPIANALINAYMQGLDVKIVLDKSQRTAKYSAFIELKNIGAPVRISTKYAIMHNKFMIIDDKILQTGSFNYSHAAENNNAENVLVISDNSKIINQYMRQWQKLWEEAT